MKAGTTAGRAQRHLLHSVPAVLAGAASLFAVFASAFAAEPPDASSCKPATAPLPEYPRPQMQRDDRHNLSGV